MDLFVLVPLGSLVALFFAAYLVRRILRNSEGTSEIKEISAFIREGAYAFLKRQYGTVAIIGSFVFLMLVGLAYFDQVSFFLPYAFVHGMISCALAGYVGMMISTRANGRATFAARTGLSPALDIAFSSGAVMGLVATGMVLMDITIWYYLLNYFYPAADLGLITDTMVSSVIGISLMAFFARVGGGIFTKAADVGADLVGKVEKGIPEDDPRNAAVIADQVGDNVGDVAGMGADLYESYISATLAAMALGVFAFSALHMGFNAMMTPLLIMVAGGISSIIGTYFVRVRGSKPSQGTLLRAVRKGVYATSLLSLILSFFIIYLLLGASNIGLFGAMAAGIVAGAVIGAVSEYYTSCEYEPTKSVAKSSESGTAPLIINGLSVGMRSTAVPIITVSIVSVLGYYMAGGSANSAMGLYGVALTAVGMLSTLGMTLATDAYGPVADNAAGIAELTHQPHNIRERLDALDGIGNTEAATGKGYVIASGALTVIALITAYKAIVSKLVGQEIFLSLLDPLVIGGLFVGAMLPYIFSSTTMRAVGKAAETIVGEVRRQWKVRGVKEGKVKPNYAKVVDICTKAALGELLNPAIIAIITPIVIGLLIGPKGTIALLLGAQISAFSMAIMMANAGASWDNAKKYIEEGHFGGKGSEQHKAAVVGDTLGDPFKDTSGPSLDGLIKLMTMISLAIAPIVVRYALLK
ncbi:MAG: sodium-translocating pyrophosphatase [Candidatus Micrarchaeota archaeon]|nr:sodium-translocating pyrophosphatase [Candidatus Micrarchaeota archaeon]